MKSRVHCGVFFAEKIAIPGPDDGVWPSFTSFTQRMGSVQNQ